MNIGVPGMLFLIIIIGLLLGLYSYFKNPRKMITFGIIYLIVSLISFIAGGKTIGHDPIVGIVQVCLGLVFIFGAAKMLLHKDRLGDGK